MVIVRRSDENPILIPDRSHVWESDASFNACAVKDKELIRLVYRAESRPQHVNGSLLTVSSIGHAKSRDGIHFSERAQLIRPEYDWERFGCEDPRVTKLDGAYYIFYTALSRYPFDPDGIRVGVARTKDFKTIDEKHLVTPFNAKAMSLFPERINGKIAALVTANTDRPPSRIGVAFFNSPEEMWSRDFWMPWYEGIESHSLDLHRSRTDHVEAGPPPILTKYGWLMIYSYIQNYMSTPKVFAIEAILLDRNDPLKILSRLERPLLVPEDEYELYGRVPNIVFPSGAIERGGELYLYYGAADSTVCLAKIKMKDLLAELMPMNQGSCLRRFDGNPVIAPNPEHPWEANATFNPGAILAGGKVHILYRAMSQDNTSVFGYASSRDGLHIDERLPEPVYAPRMDFESKLVPGGNSGCEDPRLTKIGDTLFMCYTAFDGKNPPRVALTSIPMRDFLKKRWKWEKPVLLSPPGLDDKDAALFPKKFKKAYAILHRPSGISTWIDFIDDMRVFSPNSPVSGEGISGRRWINGIVLMTPRTGRWDSKRIGIAGPPIETEAGWLLLYHGISKKEDNHYHVRASLLDSKNPTRVIARTKYAILESEMPYEKFGQVPNVVFPCGSVVLGDTLFVYYGGADTVVGVATVKLKILLRRLLKETP